MDAYESFVTNTFDKFFPKRYPVGNVPSRSPDYPRSPTGRFPVPDRPQMNTPDTTDSDDGDMRGLKYNPNVDKETPDFGHGDSIDWSKTNASNVMDIPTDYRQMTYKMIGDFMKKYHDEIRQPKDVFRFLHQDPQIQGYMGGISSAQRAAFTRAAIKAFGLQAQDLRLYGGNDGKSHKSAADMARVIQ